MNSLRHQLRRLIDSFSKPNNLHRESGLMISETLEDRMMLSAANFGFATGITGIGEEVAEGVALDSAGNIYTTGFFNGTVDFDPGTATHNLTSNGDDDIYVMKQDYDGNFLWAVNFGGSLSDQGIGIAVDAAGSVITTGYFQQTVDFDPGVATANLNAAGSDIFVSKLDANGNFVFAKQMGGASFDLGFDVTTDAGGNIYTTGAFGDTADFNPGAGTANLTASAGDDVFISKLNINGSFVWARAISGGSFETGYGIEVDNSGNVYAVGSFFGTVDFDPGAGNQSTTAEGNLDGFVVKLNSSGNYQWHATIGSTSEEEVFDIALDSQNNVIMTGVFFGQVDFNPSGSTWLLTSNGNLDSFVWKLDSNGSFIWAKGFGGDDNERGMAVTVDSVDDIYLAGSFRSQVDFDPGSGSETLNADTQENGYVSKFHANGNHVWARQLGVGVSKTVGNSIVVDSLFSVITVGNFSVGTGDFDPDETDVFNLFSNNNKAIFVSKLSTPVIYVAPTDGTPEENAIELVIQKSGNKLQLIDNKQGTIEEYDINLVSGVEVIGADNISDKIIVDFSNDGFFSFNNGIFFDGLAGTNDPVFVIGDGSSDALFFSGFGSEISELTVDSGSESMQINFQNVFKQPLTISNMNSFTLSTTNVNDQLAVNLITASGADAARISDTSNEQAMDPVVFYDVNTVTIDTSDTEFQGQDSIVFNENSFQARGLQNLFVDTGNFDDLVKLRSNDLNLDLAGGVFQIDGGTGDDLIFSKGNNNFTLTNTSLVGNGNVDISGFEEAQLIGGSSGNTMDATAFTGPLILNGKGGNDILLGGIGDDYMVGEVGDDYMDGGAGNDKLVGRDGHDQIFGRNGNDILFGDKGNDRLEGGTGDDRLSGHAGSDTLKGGDGEDQLRGFAGADNLNGGKGNDYNHGGDGADHFTVDASGANEDITLNKISNTRVQVERRFVTGTLQEDDEIRFDSTDHLEINALGGTDDITADPSLSLDGTIDGGSGTDHCFDVPAHWTIISCF